MNKHKQRQKEMIYFFLSRTTRFLLKEFDSQMKVFRDYLRTISKVLVDTYY